MCAAPVVVVVGIGISCPLTLGRLWDNGLGQRKGVRSIPVTHVLSEFYVQVSFLTTSSDPIQDYIFELLDDRV